MLGMLGGGLLGGAAGIAATVPQPRPDAAPAGRCEPSHFRTAVRRGRAPRYSRAVQLVYPRLGVDLER